MKENVLFLICIVLLISCNAQSASTEVRKSVLAGSWYSANPEVLAATIDNLLNKTVGKKPLKNPLMVILPHAGYQYSGMVAATGYNLIKNTQPDIIVIMAPSHHRYFRGCSTLGVDFYETPLGRVRVEKQMARKLLESYYFNTDSYAHRHEHAIEIHLPFLQRTFKERIKGIGILPILVGEVDSEDAVKIAQALMNVVRNKSRPLFIVSTDFTHYGIRFSYVPFSSRRKDVLIKKLRELDYGAIETILKKDAEGFADYVKKTGITICGRNPIKIALSIPVAEFDSELIAYSTSGDITGDYDNSVSYAAIALRGRIAYSTKNPESRFTLTDKDKRFLLSLARRNIQSNVLHNRSLQLDRSKVPPCCTLKRGVFVTLKMHDDLRGCIGYVDGIKPIYQAVIDNSFNAAFRDPRFQPLRKDELRAVTIEISVLTEPREIDSINEIEIGRDGLIIGEGPSRGLLLPQVPVEWGWNREEFLIHTCRKARLPDNAWRDKKIRIYRFQAIVFSEGRMK